MLRHLWGRECAFWEVGPSPLYSQKGLSKSQKKTWRMSGKESGRMEEWEAAVFFRKWEQRIWKHKEIKFPLFGSRKDPECLVRRLEIHVFRKKLWFPHKCRWGSRNGKDKLPSNDKWVKCCLKRVTSTGAKREKKQVSKSKEWYSLQSDSF